MSYTSQPSNITGIVDRWSGEYYKNRPYNLHQELEIQVKHEDVEEISYLRYKDGTFHIMVLFKSVQAKLYHFPDNEKCWNFIKLQAGSENFTELHAFVVENILLRESICARLDNIVRTFTLQ